MRLPPMRLPPLVSLRGGPRSRLYSSIVENMRKPLSISFPDVGESVDPRAGLRDATMSNLACTRSPPVG